LTREGSSDSDFCLLKSGQAEVTATSRGRQVLLELLDAYDCFGEAAALSSVPRAATVTAITPVEYYALRKADVAEIVRRYPAVKSELQTLSMERFVEAARLLAE
jgi:putative ABC transport system ATP-binding protein